MLDKNFVPQKPFPNFKWKWASYAPTESINDPVVLLGVLFRMEKLEGKYAFSSKEFEKEMEELSYDLKDSIGIDLAGRSGERNIMRNSMQYWKSLNLLPKNVHGIIELTDFGRMVAKREISQAEFSAISVMTHKLPNSNIQKDNDISLWKKAGIVIYPLKLILSVAKETEYLTAKELYSIIIPLSAYPNCTIADYSNFIKWNRAGEINISLWPNCCEKANDKRMAREFLLFLANFGYLIKESGTNEDAKFSFNSNLRDEIDVILTGISTNPTIEEAIKLLNSSDAIAEFERKIVQNSHRRPHQAQFRKEVLKACERCVITSVTMYEVLEAAHIKPFKYNGEDTISNGFAMRLDIHMLFDTGHLRIDEKGVVELSGRARLDYGSSIPPKIVIPDFINKEFIKWRWENYNGMSD